MRRFLLGLSHSLAEATADPAGPPPIAPDRGRAPPLAATVAARPPRRRARATALLVGREHAVALGRRSASTRAPCSSTARDGRWRRAPRSRGSAGAGCTPAPPARALARRGARISGTAQHRQRGSCRATRARGRPGRRRAIAATASGCGRDVAGHELDPPDPPGRVRDRTWPSTDRARRRRPSGRPAPSWPGARGRRHRASRPASSSAAQKSPSVSASPTITRFPSAWPASSPPSKRCSKASAQTLPARGERDEALAQVAGRRRRRAVAPRAGPTSRRRRRR